MNKVILIGRITKDIELKKAGEYNTISFSIAVDKKFKNKDGVREADFISCVAWNKTAENISKYFHKGSKIAIEGSIQTRNYEKDGSKIYVTEVLVEGFDFIESSERSGENSTPAPSVPTTQIAPEPELPFDF